MKNKFLRKKFAVAAVTSAMVLNSVPALGAGFTDTNNHWANKQIDKWSNYGIVNGYEGKFNPDSSITRGEMAVIIDRIMNYQTSAKNDFKDLDRNYYTDSILKIYNAGVMNGDGNGNVNPKDNITREQAAVLLAKAFSVDAAEGKTSFKDNSKISSWAMPYVVALTQKGYINGKPDGTFAPQDKLTRAEAITIIDNMLETLYNQAGVNDVKLTIEGTVVVNTPNVTLKNKIIAGDLIIAEGVGEGDLYLEDVTVLGNLIVKGGGENSIHILGKSSAAKVVVAKVDGSVRVAVAETSEVNVIYINDGKDDVIVTGKIGSVELNTSNAQVTALNAQIGNIEVKVPEVKLVLDKSAKVENISVDKNAEGAKLNLNGTINNVKVEAKEAKVEVAESAVVANVTVTAANTELKVEGKIEKVDTTKEASGLNIKGDGEVKEAEIKAEDVKVETEGTKIETSEGIEVDTKDDSKTDNKDDDKKDEESNEDEDNEDKNEDDSETKLTEAKKLIEDLNLSMSMTTSEIKSKVNALELPEGVTVEFTISAYKFAIITIKCGESTDSVVISVKDNTEVVDNIYAQIKEMKIILKAEDYAWHNEAVRAIRAKLADITAEAEEQGVAVTVSGGKQRVSIVVNGGTYKLSRNLYSQEYNEISSALNEIVSNYEDVELTNEIYEEIYSKFEAVEDKVLANKDKYYGINIGISKLEDDDGSISAVIMVINNRHVTTKVSLNDVERGGSTSSSSYKYIVSKGKYVVRSVVNTYADTYVAVYNEDGTVEKIATKDVTHNFGNNWSTINSYAVVEKGKKAEITVDPKETSAYIINSCTLSVADKSDITEDGSYVFTISADKSNELSNFAGISMSRTSATSRITRIINAMDLDFSMYDENALENVKNAIESQEEIAGILANTESEITYKLNENGCIGVLVRIKRSEYSSILSRAIIRSKEMKEVIEAYKSEISNITWSETEKAEDIQKKIDAVDEKLRSVIVEKLGETNKDLEIIYISLLTDREATIALRNYVGFEGYDYITSYSTTVSLDNIVPIEGKYYVKAIANIDYEYLVDGVSIGKEGYVADGKEVVVKFSPLYNIRNFYATGSYINQYNFDTNVFSAYVDGKNLSFSVSYSYNYYKPLEIAVLQLEQLGLMREMSEEEISRKIAGVNLPSGVEVVYERLNNQIVMLNVSYNGVVDYVTLGNENTVSEVLSEVINKIKAKNIVLNAADYETDADAVRWVTAQIQDIIDEAAKQNVEVTVDGGKQYIYITARNSNTSSKLSIYSEESKEILADLNTIKTKYVADTLDVNAIYTEFEALEAKIKSDNKYKGLNIGISTLKDENGNAEAVIMNLRRAYTTTYVTPEIAEMEGSSGSVSFVAVTAKDKYLVRVSNLKFADELSYTVYDETGKETKGTFESVSFDMVKGNDYTYSLDGVAVFDKGKKVEITAVSDKYPNLSCSMSAASSIGKLEEGKCLITILPEKSNEYVDSYIASLSLKMTSSNTIINNLISIIRNMNISYSITDENYAEIIEKLILNKPEISKILLNEKDIDIEFDGNRVRVSDYTESNIYSLIRIYPVEYYDNSSLDSSYRVYTNIGTLYVDGKEVEMDSYVQNGKEVVLKVSPLLDISEVRVSGANINKYDFTTNTFSAYVTENDLSFYVTTNKYEGQISSVSEYVYANGNYVKADEIVYDWVYGTPSVTIKVNPENKLDITLTANSNDYVLKMSDKEVEENNSDITNEVVLTKEAAEEYPATFKDVILYYYKEGKKVGKLIFDIIVNSVK